MECARALAGPVGKLGGAWMFDAEVHARGAALGLDAWAWYHCGRGGVLGAAIPRSSSRRSASSRPRCRPRRGARASPSCPPARSRRSTPPPAAPGAGPYVHRRGRRPARRPAHDGPRQRGGDGSAAVRRLASQAARRGPGPGAAGARPAGRPRAPRRQPPGGGGGGRHPTAAGRHVRPVRRGRMPSSSAGPSPGPMPRPHGRPWWPWSRSPTSSSRRRTPPSTTQTERTRAGVRAL